MTYDFSQMRNEVNWKKNKPNVNRTETNEYKKYKNTEPYRGEHNIMIWSQSVAHAHMPAESKMTLSSLSEPEIFRRKRNAMRNIRRKY